MTLFKYFKRVDISVLLPGLKGTVVVYITTTLQHFLSKNIHVDVVSSDHIVYRNNDSTLEIQLHTPLHMMILQNHVIGLLCRYQI